MEISSSETNDAGPQKQYSNIRLEVQPTYVGDKKTLSKT